MASLLKVIFSLILIFGLHVAPVFPARDTDSYDGNIFPIYAGNGSLVPPKSNLSDSLKKKRTSVIIFYLDDSSTSKAFAPVVSGLKLLWNTSIDLIPLTIDEFQGKQSNDPKDESYYWRGRIPQIVVIDKEGHVVLDKEGQTSISEINEAISKATGLPKPEFEITIKTFNDYNSEPEKEGYTAPRETS